ncbi:hypothetical protein HYPSUDRAFT_209060 [Hypholoma sublateritium FD-334 SS-4]|uniref:Uncharacterized protein n=1 Tax=Hypholoma sublateritium (strain FD-334 SS-4) TaxID=945553 RepID=A0A0D2NBR8_HYPSF|nr:hypothetical protein HYPSUDRAFT_209060 [Hypholoma sublateritium FD-334 SS-4]
MSHPPKGGSALPSSGGGRAPSSSGNDPPATGTTRISSATQRALLAAAAAAEAAGETPPRYSGPSAAWETYSTPVPSSRTSSWGGTAVPSRSATPMQTEFSPLPSESPEDMGGYGATPDPEDPESSDDEGGGEAPADPFVVESMPHPVVLRGAAASWGDRQLSYCAAHISIQQIADWITAEGSRSVVATESSDPFAMQAAVGALRRATNAVPWAKPAPAAAPSPAPVAASLMH